MRHQAGFTLAEMVVALLVVIILSPLVMSAINHLSAATERTYQVEIRRAHEGIASAMLAYARQDTTLGTLPAPYTGGSYLSSVLNPADITLAAQLRAAGLNTSTVNHDASAAANVRVYQRVTGLTAATPVFFQSGPLATLTYHFGVIYQTTCSRDAACNAGLPGDSSTLTAGNHTTWAEAGEDFAPVFVSTLPQQKRMMSETMRRIAELRRMITAFYRDAQLAAAASDTTNFYPRPNGAGAPDYSGANPVTNEGCHDGWYSLAEANVNVIPQVGLSQAEFGSTAWGGAIQYCPDYDPAATGTATADQPPHAAALRVHQSLSSGVSPGAPGNNLVFPM